MPKSWQRELAEKPRVREMRQKRWTKLRALAEDDRFVDETVHIRRDLKLAYSINPETVEEFFRQFSCPTPSLMPKIISYLKHQKTIRMRRILWHYIKYASRFSVYMVWRKRKNRGKFWLRAIVPSGAKIPR